MALLSRAVAALRVSGEDLLPAEVTELLGAEPSRAYARGDEIGGRHGAPRTAKFGLWSCSALETEPANIDEQVAALLGRLNPSLEAWQGLADRFQMDFFCGWFMAHLNEGLEIAPATLMALAQRQIVLSLDIYGHGQDEV